MTKAFLSFGVLFSIIGFFLIFKINIFFGIIFLIIGLFFFVKGYLMFKLGNIKIITDKKKYYFGDYIRYKVRLIIKEGFKDDRDLKIEFYGVDKVKSGNEYKYIKRLIISKKIDSLNVGKIFNKIKRTYNGEIKIPDNIEEIMSLINNNVKKEYEKMKTLFDSENKDIKVLSDSVIFKKLGVSEKVVNGYEQFIKSNNIKYNLKHYIIRVILDDKRNGLKETDLIDEVKFFIR